MNIIVTKKKVEYKGFLKLSTLQEVTETVGSIDFLVYNRSDENPEDKVTYLSQLKNRVSQYVYISSEKDTDLVVKMVIVGLDGKYFDDEDFFLNNGNELLNLSLYIDEVTDIADVGMGGVSVLQDFFTRYLQNGNASFSPMYLTTVKEAVQCLISDYNSKTLEILQMSENATELFSSTTEILSGMRKEHGEMRRSIEKLEEEVKKGATLNKSVLEDYRKSAPSLLFFPQVSYMKEKKIIRIKELGNVQYLVSFTLGYRIYLETIKNVRAKLIVVESVGDFLEDKYADYSWVTQRRVKDRKYYYNNVVFTNCPNKEVLFSLLDDVNYDTFVVVDRTKNNKNHILNSKGNLFYAVSGKSLIEKYRLQAKNCFTSGLKVKGSLFDIKRFSEYPDDKSARERLYLSSHSNEYGLLY